MEIRQGYKQTEVGIIPEEWEVKKIKDILEIGSGKDYKKLSSGDIPVFGTGGYMLSVDDFLYNGESVFIGRKGTINKPFYYKGKFWTVDTLFYTYNFRNVFPKWVLYKFDTINWLKYNEASGVPSLSKQTIYNIDIAIPPLKEQEKIAEILSYYDKVIEQQELLIEKEKEFKKGIMQKIFSQEIRFKDDNGEEYPEWEEYKYKKIFKVNQGLQIAIENRYLDYAEGRFLYITNEFLKKDSKINYYIQNPKESVICNEDDILMTRTGNTGEVLTNVKGVFHNNFFKIEYDRKVFNKNFIYYLLKSRRVKNLILRLAGSSTIPDLNHNDFYSIKSKFPIKKEQEKIANFLSDIDNKIELLENKLELLKNEKKGMMQKLLTGEVRV